jgi:uncharacterized protein (DUF433 family)
MRVDSNQTSSVLPIHSDKEILSGVPVFVGTRVPAQTLFDYFVDNCKLGEFLEDFPTVKREQALDLLMITSKIVQDEVNAVLK